MENEKFTLQSDNTKTEKKEKCKNHFLRRNFLKRKHKVRKCSDE